jgi:hypothetical protein
MNEKEVVLSAIDAVVIPNKEAGVNTDYFTVKSDFDEFCVEIMSCEQLPPPQYWLALLFVRCTQVFQSL